MTPKAKEYRNGWSTYMGQAGWLYEVFVRNARGDIHDKIRCDDYRSAMDYWKVFNAIAKTGEQ